MENTATVKRSTKLTEENVMEIIGKCFYDDSEIKYKNTEDGKKIPIIPKDAITVEGIINKFCFEPSKIESQRENIEAMIDELPDVF